MTSISSLQLEKDLRYNSHWYQMKAPELLTQHWKDAWLKQEEEQEGNQEVFTECFGSLKCLDLFTLFILSRLISSLLKLLAVTCETGVSVGLPNHVMCLLSQVRAFLLPVSRAPLHGMRQKVLIFAPALKSARLSSRIPPKLSLAADTRPRVTWLGARLMWSLATFYISVCVSCCVWQPVPSGKYM